MRIEQSGSGVILHFNRQVRVLSSASVRGGMVRARLIVNLKTSSEEVMQHTPEELVSAYLRGRGLDRAAVGLLTSADLAHAQLILRESEGLAVLAVVTAGVSNAINSAENTGSEYLGDGAAPVPFGSPGARGTPEPGTINIVTVTNRSLTDEAMVGSVVVATEAKSAALFDLGVKSVTTGSQATGTGTDSVAVVSGFEGGIRYAGGHTRYGQLLGEAVYTGVRRSLEKTEPQYPPEDLLNMLLPF
jgi:adenosylcobinamide amidohydrolase